MTVPFSGRIRLLGRREGIVLVVEGVVGGAALVLALLHHCGDAADPVSNTSLEGTHGEHDEEVLKGASESFKRQIV